MKYLRAAKNWGHTSARAVFYGTIGTSIGWIPAMRPLTHWCMNRWCTGTANALKIQREVIHGERIDQVGQAILVANHLSSLDVLILGSFLRRDFRWLAKANLFDVPFSGWYLRNAGHIPVHRGEQSKGKNGTIATHIHRACSEGASVLFFPEGTRSRDGNLKPFRMGAFNAAVQEDLPVLPLVIRGTHELMASGAIDLSIRADRSCSVTVLEPIKVEDECDEKDKAHQLRDLVYQAYQRELSS